MTQSPRTKWDALSRRSMATALRAWHDLPRLGEHPLVQLDIVEHCYHQSHYRDGTGGYGLALRQVLRETIDLLRPDRGAPNPQDRQWFPYLILLEQDVSGRSRAALMALLGTNGLPERTYDHLRAEAIDRLVNLLRERELEMSRPIDSSASRRYQHVDWGDAPHVSAFHGRQAELAQIEGWLNQRPTRLISVLGLGGVGKTALAAQLIRLTAARFERVIWRSLRNAPPLAELLADVAQTMSNQAEVELPASLDDRLALVFELLQAQRCLLMLDNLETILRAGTIECEYRSGHAEYGEFLRRVIELPHRSCVIITSRETPPEVAARKDARGTLWVQPLQGLTLNECRDLLKEATLRGVDADWQQFVAAYSGNPLALKVVAETVRDLFGGDLACFMSEGVLVFGDVRQVLDQQLARLSPLERDVLYWLAIERDTVTLDRLRRDLVIPVSRRDVLEALEALRRRSLLEQAREGFILPNLILEHVTDHFVDRLSHEIAAGTIGLLNSHAVLQAHGPETLRRAQVRLIVQPVIEQTAGRLGSVDALRERLLTDMSPVLTGYAGGNTLNLLHHAGVTLHGVDLAGWTIREAYLVETELVGANLSRADVSGAMFAEALHSISSLAISHDGRWLAAGTTSNDIHVWSWDDGRRLLTLRGHTNVVRSLAFSPDDQTLASASSDQTVRLWDTHTGECRLTLTGHIQRVRCVAFTADGSCLFSGGSDQTIREWDAITGELLRTLHGHAATVWTIALSPDDQILISGGYDGAIQVWDVSTGSIRATLRDHTAAIRSVIFSPNGQYFASGSEDCTVRIWDAQSLACLHVLTAHHKWVHAVAFSPDGNLLASAGEDGLIRMWDVASGASWRVLRGHANSIEALAFPPDGRVLASGSNDQSIQLWNPRTGQRLRKLGDVSDTQWTFAFGHQGRWLFSGGNDSLTHRWAVDTWQHEAQYRGHTSWINAVALSPDDQILATCSTDLTIKLWDVASRRCKMTLYGHTAWPSYLAFSPTDPYLASAGEDSTIRIWNIETGHCLQVLTDFTGSVRDVTFSPDGQCLLACGDDRLAIGWDTKTWQPALMLRDHTSAVWTARFNASGSLIATGDESGLIKIWDTLTGLCLRTLPPNPGRAWVIDFHPNGEWLVASGGDEFVRVWNVHTGNLVKTLVGHTGPLRFVLYSPDGRFIVSSADDHSTRVWDAETGDCVHILHLKRLYEGLQIAEVRGLSEAQRASLKTLGAVED